MVFFKVLKWYELTKQYNAIRSVKRTRHRRYWKHIHSPPWIAISTTAVNTKKFILYRKTFSIRIVSKTDIVSPEVNEANDCWRVSVIFRALALWNPIASVHAVATEFTKSPKGDLSVLTAPGQFLRSLGTGSAHHYAFMKRACTKCDG